jgi:hypothetical protein
MRRRKSNSDEHTVISRTGEPEWTVESGDTEREVSREVAEPIDGPLRQGLRTSVQLQSTNARTLPKSEEYQRPESKTNQQLSEPCEICKTSIPVQIRAAPPILKIQLTVSLTGTASAS